MPFKKRIAVADISIAAVHHDLDAVAAPALVGVANELDVAGCYAFMAHALPFRLALRHRVGGAITSRVRPLISDASECTRSRVGSPPERTVRSSCAGGLRFAAPVGGHLADGSAAT